MRATAIFCILLCMSLCYSVRINTELKTMTMSQIKSMVEDIEGTPTGDMIMSFAEVFTAIQGPIDQLVKEITNLSKDLSTKLANENRDFKAATVNHVNRVNQLEGEITSAKNDITSTTTLLQTNLYPTRDQLQKAIAQLKDDIEQNKKNQESATNKRNKENKEYNQRQADHKAAAEALDEALNLVRGLQNKGGKVAFAQMQTATQAIIKVQKAMANIHSIYTPFVHALISLSQNFSDQGAVAKVLELLQKMRDNVAKSDKAEDEKEAEALKNYKEYMADMAKKLNTLQNTLAAREQDLKDTLKKIKENEAFLAKRKSDLKKLENDLKEENESFAKLTAAHKDLVATIKNEQETVAKAVKILKSVKVREYLMKRANTD